MKVLKSCNLKFNGGVFPAMSSSAGIWKDGQLQVQHFKLHTLHGLVSNFRTILGATSVEMSWITKERSHEALSQASDSISKPSPPITVWEVGSGKTSILGFKSQMQCGT
jgi:hypothetical protein